MFKYQNDANEPISIRATHCARMISRHPFDGNRREEPERFDEVDSRRFCQSCGRQTSRLPLISGPTRTVGQHWTKRRTGQTHNGRQETKNEQPSPSACNAMHGSDFGKSYTKHHNSVPHQAERLVGWIGCHSHATGPLPIMPAMKRSKNNQTNPFPHNREPQQYL